MATPLKPFPQHYITQPYYLGTESYYRVPRAYTDTVGITQGNNSHYIPNPTVLPVYGHGSNIISEYNGFTGKVLYTYTVGSGSGNVSINGAQTNPSRSHLYYMVQSGLSNTVNSIVDYNIPANTYNRTITSISGNSYNYQTWTVDSGCNQFYVYNNQNAVYVYNFSDGSLSTVISGYFMGTNSSVAGMVVSPDNSALYVGYNVGGAYGNSTIVINLPAGTLNTIISGYTTNQYGLAINSDNTFLYISDYDAGRIRVFNIPSYTYYGNITTGVSSYNLAWDPAYSSLYATDGFKLYTITSPQYPNTFNVVVSGIGPGTTWVQAVGNSFSTPKVNKLNTTTQVSTNNTNKNLQKLIKTIQTNLSQAIESVYRKIFGKIHISENLYGGEQLYSVISAYIPTQYVRAIAIVLVREIKEQKLVKKLTNITNVKAIKLTKLKVAILRTVKTQIIRLNKSIGKKDLLVTGINIAKISKTKNTSVKINQTKSSFFRVIVNKKINTVLVNNIKQFKLANKITKIVKVFTNKNIKKKTTNIYSVQTNINKQQKLKSAILRIVQIRTGFWTKGSNIITKVISVVQINLSKLNKQKSTTIRVTKINSIQSKKLINKFKNLVQTNINRINKQKQSIFRITRIQNFKINKQKQSILRANSVQTFRMNKVKSTILRTVKFSSIFLKKSVFKGLRVTYVQTAGEIAGAIVRLISVVSVRAIRSSKFVGKKLTVDLVKTVRNNKLKSTHVKTDQVQGTRINKQKLSILQTVRVQSLRITKTKSVVLRVVKVLTSRLNKSKSTRIKSTQVQNTKISKQKNTNIKSTQILNTTVTRRVNRKRGITSTITYTIGTSKAQTLYRQIKATLISVLNTNKGVNKNIKSTSINSSLSGKNKAWNFLIQFVTKITSFNRQIIKKPNYGRPDPDIFDPNMIDTSSPGVEGLVDNEPEDFSFDE